LDPENPRLPDGTTSDREAINRLLDDGADALIRLARDMAQTGQSNPAELPIAIRLGSKFLILEGNRRFAALKLLKDPELADSEIHRQAFRRAAALGSPPSSVHTLVTSNREEAEHWIFLRHTGENDGTGVKRWSASQTATHRRRANKTIDAGTLRSITIADELEEAYAADPEIAELVRKTRREKITNIGRFFSPEILARLRLAIEGDDTSALRPKTLWAYHTAGQLRDFFAWAMTYISDKSVDAYKNAEIRRVVVDDVTHLLPSAGDALPKSIRLADTSLGPMRQANDGENEAESHSNGDDHGESNSSNGNSTGVVSHGVGNEDDAPQGAGDSGDGQRKEGPKREARPEKYAFQDLRLPHHPRRIQLLLKQCRSLNLDDFAGVACVMIRVLVELSVSHEPVLALTSAKESDPLRDKILAALKYLDPQVGHSRRGDEKLAQAFMEVSELGIQYMNGFVHNPNVQPDQHLARRFSSAFRPLLERIDGAI